MSSKITRCAKIIASRTTTNTNRRRTMTVLEKAKQHYAARPELDGAEAIVEPLQD